MLEALTPGFPLVGPAWPKVCQGVMYRDETPPRGKVQREGVLGDRLGVAVCAGHDLDVGLPAIDQVDVVSPHGVADDAFPLGWSRQPRSISLFYSCRSLLYNVLY